jgi:Fe-S-cluster containining protein
MKSNQQKKGCLRCGRCCREVFFLIDSSYTEEGLDHLEWARYHGLKISFRENNEGKRMWGIELDTPCIHLKEEASGKASCAVYNSRPQICRNYTGENEFTDCGYA